jgi:hypothetical protein
MANSRRINWLIYTFLISGVIALVFASLYFYFRSFSKDKVVEVLHAEAKGEIYPRNTKLDLRNISVELNQNKNFSQLLKDGFSVGDGHPIWNEFAFAYEINVNANMRLFCSPQYTGSWIIYCLELQKNEKPI